MKNRLDNFNRIILDLQGVNVKIEDEDQALILLCSLMNSYENFIDTMLYGMITIIVNDVKGSLMSKDLERKVSNSCLFTCVGRTSNKCGGNIEKSSSKYKANIRCYNCK